MKETVLIIDGLNYLYRAYYGITDAIKTKKGVSINAVYGFFAFLRKAVEATDPKFIIVVFDSENAAKNKQNDLESYKANRKYEDVGMFAQLRIIKKILEMKDIMYLEENNIEADDLIGTYCNLGIQKGCSVYISSNDFDFMQLVSNDIFVLRNYKKEQQIFNIEKMEERFGVSPNSYPDYAALLGDTSDNIEGVKGIGKKTAQELICKFKSVENLIENIELLPDKLKAKIKENTNKILLNKKMILINISVSVDLLQLANFEYTKDKLRIKTADYIKELQI